MAKKKTNSRFLEKKADLLSRRNHDKNILYIVKCAEKIENKYLAIPLWLSIAVPDGLTIIELKHLTNIGIIGVENTLNDLSDCGLVQEIIPMDSRRESHFFAIHETQTALDAPNQNGSSARVCAPAKRDCIFKDYYIKSYISRRERSDRSDIGTLKNNNIKNTEQTLGKKIVLKKGVVREKTENPPRLKKIVPVRAKLKKEESSPAASGLANFVAEIEKKNRSRIRGKISYLQAPSKYPTLRAWEGKSSPAHWSTLEWVGYWLHSWEKCYGQEDPEFVGRTLYRTIKEAKKRNNGRLDEYWSHGRRMEIFFQERYVFKGDAFKMKEYLDWLFDVFVVEADWLDRPISLGQVIRKTNNHFLDRFKKQNIKPKKMNGKKPKETWNPWGVSRD